MQDQDNTAKKDGASREGGEHQNGSADNKGKGKAKDSGIFDRIQESGKLAFNALTAKPIIPEIAQGPKTAAGSARNINPSSILSGESSLSTNQVGPSGSMKTANDAIDSAEAFDDFISGSRTELSSEAMLLQLHGQSVAEHEASDGLAVVDLLSRPDDPDDMMDVLGGGDLLSLEEADRLREALFGPGDKHPSWEKLLDFSPNFVSHPEASHEAALHFGTTDAATARSLWFQQWSDVFTSYNSQVWGDLEPLVAEARLEVKRLRTQSSDVEKMADVNALGRLRQILAHVRGYR
ncbi:hypothetical protein PT974_11842 [Cladobotryum mycophilum]|uniref:Uncharacterized protein n=1 Tax=Cladobotryum mycophilum TaxID=491253 RepID=A0ABR0S7G3_9HYPO